MIITEKVPIANGAAVSSSFRCPGRVIGIRVPATWAATAVELRFEFTQSPFTVADASATWARMLDNAGAQLEVSGLSNALSHTAVPDSIRIGPVQRMRIVGTTAVPANVNQSADVTVEVDILKET